MAIFSAVIGFMSTIGGFLAAASGLSLAASVAVGQAVGYLSAAMVGRALARMLVPDVSIPIAEVQALIQQTDAPRRVYVGENLAGGVRAIFEVKGNILYQLILVQHGLLHRYVNFWIDGEPVTITGGKVSSGTASGLVEVWTRNGAAQGGDYQILRDSFAYWTADHRLQGQATFLVGAAATDGEKFTKAYPKQSQTLFQWVIEGQRVWDPRSSTTAYSQNASLIIGHYLTHDLGYRLATAEVNWPSVSAMATVADQPVPQYAGGTAPSLQLAGYWSSDEDPLQVLDRMRISSGIAAYETQDGTIGLIGGPFGTPACTLTAKDIQEIRTSEAISEREGFNVLRVQFRSAAHRYEMIEVGDLRDAERLTIEGEITEEFVPEMCPNQSQARRLAKRFMADHNCARIEVITNAVGLKARYPRYHGQRHTILLDYRPEDGSGRVITGEYEVRDHVFDPIGMRCRIDLRRIDRASDAWTVAEEGPPPEPLPAKPNNPPPAFAGSLSVVVTATTSTSRQAHLSLEVPPIAGRDDLTIDAQCQMVDDVSGPWLPMTATGLVAVSGAVEDTKSYRVRARFKGTFDDLPAWTTLGPVVVRVNAVPPAAPTQLIVSPGASGVHASWRNPPSGFVSLRLYRGTSGSFGAAVLISSVGGSAGQISETSDPSAATGVPYFYWVAAVNDSLIEGPPVGPASITL